jgi:hypothetical protein
MTENLYNYIFWENTLENVCYAIERDTQLAFFNGRREEALYFKGKNFDVLRELLTKEKLVKKYVIPAKEALKKNTK